MFIGFAHSKFENLIQPDCVSISMLNLDHQIYPGDMKQDVNMFTFRLPALLLVMQMFIQSLKMLNVMCLCM